MSCLSNIGVKASNLDVERIGLDFFKHSSPVGNASFGHSEIQVKSKYCKNSYIVLGSIEHQHFPR